MCTHLYIRVCIIHVYVHIGKKKGPPRIVRYLGDRFFKKRKSPLHKVLYNIHRKKVTVRCIFCDSQNADRTAPRRTLGLVIATVLLKRCC